MTHAYRHIAQRIVAIATLALITFVAGCAGGASFANHQIKKRPRSRVGRYASPTLGTIFAEPDNLGIHGYANGWSERTGIVYTCKAGHIDLAHVRKAADWTAYLTANIREQLSLKKTEFSFKFKEPSRYYVRLTYPPFWDDLPQNEKDRITNETSIRLAQYFAFVGCTWHEILTWFGYRSVALYPEFPSAFSWEDSFSDLLGTHIGAKALRDTENEYDLAMTMALKKELADLGIQSRQTALQASRKVRGLWFSGDFLFLVDMKGRNFDIGVDDGFVTPWLVSDLEQCPQAEPMPYPAPSLDFLDEYGFSIEFEVEPRVLQKAKILSIVYPDRKQRKNRIEPAVHFAAIMDSIKKEAVKKHGYAIDPGTPLRQVKSQLAMQNIDKTASGEPLLHAAIAMIINIDDLNKDGIIDFKDVAIMVDAWLAKGTIPKTADK